MFEKEMDFRYIEVMKQRMILKPDQIQRTVFNKDMKRSLEVLQFNNKDLQAFLMEVSSHNPFLRYQASDEAQTDFTMVATQKPSLLDVMLEQNRFEKNSLSEDMIAYLTSMLDSNGYFKENLSSLVSQSIYTKKEIMQAIDQLRHMEPLGCYCFHLKESLKVQCEVSPHAASETGEILCDYLKELSSHDYSTIVEGTGLSLEEIEEGFQFIKSLNPKPGCNYAKDSIALQPEARVSVEQGQVLVEMINQDFELDVLEYSSRELKALRQEAVLDYQVIRQGEGSALLDITLHTGRHHQIRVQLAHLGTPICGDHKYGKAERGTPALCSYHIDFVHPVSGKEMTYEISPRNFETEC